MKYDYEKQVDMIVNYIRDGEVDRADFRVGTEIEHFIIHKDSLETVSYYGENGVETTFEDLIAEKNWQGEKEGDHILTVRKKGVVITLEPGSQFEFNSTPKASLKELEDDYFLFLEDVIPILEKKNQALVNLGYHPLTKIDDIRILPKKRYDFMYDYFKTKGSHAHNMMKGTAALQVAIDYESEEDYVKKFKLANGLSPVIYAMVDNAYYFEGQAYDRHNLRAYIWENTDKERSGVVRTSFDQDFSYRKYAEYILDNPPIFIDDGQELYYTGDKKVREILDPDNTSLEALEHSLTMFFPDVRTKFYIEIRMMDSIPYPLNFGLIALIKGIFYDEDNLDRAYEIVKDLSYEDIIESKEDIYVNGLEGHLKSAKIKDLAKILVAMAKTGLEPEELKYILPLEEMVEKELSPYDLTKSKAGQGRRQSIDWAISEKIPERL